MKKRERSFWGSALTALLFVAIVWFSEGHIPRASDLIYILFAFYIMGAIGDSLERIGGALAEIKEQNEELKEQIERLEETVDEIDGRVPRNTRSVLDEY